MCVAGPGDVEDGQGLGGLAGGDGDGADAAFERGEALLEDSGGRVHDPGVDVAELLEPEEPRGVVGVLELVGGRRVDRHGAGAGGRVGLLAGVEGERLEAGKLHVGH